MFGSDADVLNRTHDAAGNDGLNRAAIDGVFFAGSIPGNQPGTRRQEVALTRDILHQFAAAFIIAQAGKHAGIKLRAEAVVLGDSVAVDGSQFPGTPAIAFGKRGVFQSRVGQLDFHSKSTKVCFGKVHECLAEYEEPNRKRAVHFQYLILPFSILLSIWGR